MASEALIKALEEQDALDQASDKIQPLVTGAFKSAGPATFPQPCFETRVRDGQIEVRAGHD